MRVRVRCEKPTAGVMRPNNPIKLSARVVTPRAAARVAPTRPAAYRVRWADRFRTETRPFDEANPPHLTESTHDTSS